MRRLALALLLLLALPAPAAADHLYSHRYVFEGRLMGADALPLPGRTVEFFAEGDSFEEPCVEGHAPVTDANGDFRFCFHKHDLNVSTRVGVRVGNASLTRAVDTGIRRTVVMLTEPNETGVAPPDWNLTHLVAGRVWRQGPGTLEGVRVFGEALAHVQVNVTLRTSVDAGTNLQAETDAYGDFRFPVRLLREADGPNLTLELETLGHRQTRTLDLETHRITVGLLLPAERGTPGPVRIDAPTGPRSVGEASPPLQPGLVLAVFAGLAGSILLSRRKKD